MFNLNGQSVTLSDNTGFITKSKQRSCHGRSAKKDAAFKAHKELTVVYLTSFGALSDPEKQPVHVTLVK